MGLSALEVEPLLPSVSLPLLSGVSREEGSVLGVDVVLNLWRRVQRRNTTL